MQKYPKILKESEDFYFLTHFPRHPLPGWAGNARVFKWNGLAWEQKGQDIQGSAASVYLGEIVAISSDGNIIAAGESGHDEAGTNAGAVFVYQWNSANSAWDQMGPTILGKAAGDWTGTGPQSIDISSDGMTVAVGAGSSDTNGNSDAGHVTVYRFNNSGSSPVWDQVGQEIQGTAECDWLGWTVSLSHDGQTVAVSADFWDTAGYVQVYMLSLDATTWEQMGQDIQAQADGDEFGVSFSLSGNGKTVVVGGSDNGVESGYVQVYNWNSAITAWEQVGQDVYGEADGAGGNDNANGVDAGHVRVFKWNSSEETWEQVGQDIDGEAGGDMSGLSTAISADGSIVAIGAQYNDGNGDSAEQLSLKYQFAYLERHDNETKSMFRCELDRFGIFADKAKSIAQSNDIVGHDNFPMGCRWAPDGTCVLTATSSDGKLRLYDTPFHRLGAKNDGDVVCSSSADDKCSGSQMAAEDTASSIRDGPQSLHETVPETSCHSHNENAATLELAKSNSSSHNDSLHSWEASLTSHQGGPPPPSSSSSYTFYPHFNSASPPTALYATCRGHSLPIHLIDAYTSSLRASYRPHNNVDELEGPTIVEFSPDGSKIYGTGFKTDRTIKWDLGPFMMT
eukprot:scaffold225600_cov36-Cyclotella_meneghiniana.AAC.1